MRASPCSNSVIPKVSCAGGGLTPSSTSSLREQQATPYHAAPSGVDRNPDLFGSCGELWAAVEPRKRNRNLEVGGSTPLGSTRPVAQRPTRCLDSGSHF